MLDVSPKSTLSYSYCESMTLFPAAAVNALIIVSHMTLLAKFSLFF